MALLLKRLLWHSVITIAITIFLIILCWPHMIEEIQRGNFLDFFSLIVKNTINWNDGPKTGFVNGEYYEVFNTPKTYFLDVITYRLPFYFTLLIIFTYLLFLTKNLIAQSQIKYFNQKFLLINILGFFPIILALILGVNIYDNLRLFLFIIPFFSLIAAFSIDQLFNTFKKSWLSKTSLAIVLILFSLSFYRFILLTPYQYDYINYSFLKFEDSKGKFEHDYWGHLIKN